MPTKPITAEIKINGPGSAAPMVAEVIAVRRNKKIRYHERTETDCALGKKAKINRLPEQPGDMPRTYADISKARKLLGYNPTTKLSEGLPRFVEWFLQNQRTARTE